MQLYPIFADISQRTVLVIGGGMVAERKVTALLKAGALLTVHAVELTPLLQKLSDEKRITRRMGSFSEDWLDDVWLVVAATDKPDLNRQVAAAAQRQRLFANVVDDLGLSSFHVPAVIDRSPLIIAISSGGAAPMLARLLRERLETLLDDSLGALAKLAERLRPRVRQRHPEIAGRRRFYDQLFNGPVPALLRQNRPDDAMVAAEDTLKAVTGGPVGSVVLVGAGPGDPGLLTLRALRALNEADVILHDHLVSTEVLELARRDAERIEVGKQAGDHHTTQEGIHALLLQHAGAGRRVVRLKGGDPFVFGRGGEELEFLRGHGIPYEVVPGITAAVACAAYAGVPLTHRDHAQSVRFVTAHCRASIDTLDWTALAQARQTLAVYMGVGELANLQQRLIDHGRAPSTPFALIENGSRREQRVVTGTLANLADRARTHTVRSPALLVLGEVAELANRLNWFGSPPLGGQVQLIWQPDGNGRKPSCPAPVASVLLTAIHG